MVLKSIASTYEVNLPICATDALPSYRPKEKIPSEKKIIILRVRNKLEPTLISIAGAGRGQNYFSNTFASPGKIVSVVFSC